MQLDSSSNFSQRQQTPRSPRGLLLAGCLLLSYGVVAAGRLLAAGDTTQPAAPANAAAQDDSTQNDSFESVAVEEVNSAYGRLILADEPVAYWRFEETTGDFHSSVGPAGEKTPFATQTKGKVDRNLAGPGASAMGLFSESNRAIGFTGDGASLRIADPGDNSPFDFHAGDQITIEAWIQPGRVTDGRHMYLIGKGRTGNAGFPRENQNWAFRLRGIGGTARLSFLYRDTTGDSPDKAQYHRWNSDEGLNSSDGKWHHVAVTYTFGEPDSARGYLDGVETRGTWDMGGTAGKSPVVDNDEIWIGTTLGGIRGASFIGGIDEIAIYRKALPAERFTRLLPKVAPAPSLAESAPPRDSVRVEVVENIPDKKSWAFPSDLPPSETYTESNVDFSFIPQAYNSQGIKVDRSNPFLLRASSIVQLPEEELNILVRARSGSRLFIDGQLVAQSDFHHIAGSAHGVVDPFYEAPIASLPRLERGDSEKLVKWTGDGKLHRIDFEVIVGGQGRRPEPGDSLAAIGPVGGDLALLSPTEAIPFTAANWDQYSNFRREEMVRRDQARRLAASQDELAYWNKRHKIARQAVQTRPAVEVPAAIDGYPARNEVDHFINAKLAAAKLSASPEISDWSFLRRVTLDVTGTIPTPVEIAEFEKDTAPGRRSRVIERLLESPGWADHWVSYWQDVLAENPNIVNPTLNNTGPFRWWIYESLLDNKPIDRFATELIMMEGSVYFGGPGGFSLATQNDAPMAAKAHVIAQAFLGVELKCARCHDAPFHDLLQRDLFSLAAMLNRSSQSVPGTSTIPASPEDLARMIVTVSLKPGEPVAPEWPFDNLIDVEGGIPAGVLRNAKDTRELLAATVTSPNNTRFAQVVVNRMWQRLLGYGITEPVDDWEHAQPSHPELLAWLSRELVLSGYDLKHIARLILNSDVYQRQTSGSRDDIHVGETYLFAGPLQRRMTAEQIVDSMFTASQMEFDAGPMNIDIDSARAYRSSLNLGEPQRAWQFASMSNERDRPSLSLPFIEPFVTTLETFGWPSTRQNPISYREQEATILQPAILENGTLATRIATASDRNGFTELALDTKSPDELVEQAFKRLLTRPPQPDEKELFTTLLSEGFSHRRQQAELQTNAERDRLRGRVGWSNHLSPRANEIKVELAEAVKKGDPPTRRLESDWRERLEDMLWSILNSPEFVFVP